MVTTQGHAIVAHDLASTLAVEVTLHHLDLVAHLGDTAGSACPAGLAEVREVVCTLLDRYLRGWSDVRVALVGTGRDEPTPTELVDLADAQVPVFT